MAIRTAGRFERLKKRGWHSASHQLPHFQCVCGTLATALVGSLFILQWVIPPLGSLPSSILGRANCFLYSLPLNNKGLNWVGPLTRRFFSVVKTMVIRDPWSVESADTEPQIQRHRVHKSTVYRGRTRHYTWILDGAEGQSS